MRILIAAFLIAHGVVHMFVWIIKPKPGTTPFDPAHSWLFGPARGLAAPLSAIAMVMLIVAGVALLFHGGIWRPVAVVGLAVSLFLDIAFFDPWLAFIAVVNAGMIYGLVVRHWPAASTVGS